MSSLIAHNGKLLTDKEGNFFKYGANSGTINITENGTHNVNGKEYANVNVPNPSTGTLPITENGSYNVTDYAEVSVNIPVPDIKNVQSSPVMKNIKSSSMTSTGSSIVVAKTGTYKCTWVQWSQAAGTSSANYSSQLYVAGSAVGSSHYAYQYNNTTASNFIVTETNISLTEGQTIEVRARSRGTSYYIDAGMLVIEEQ